MLAFYKPSFMLYLVLGMLTGCDSDDEQVAPIVPPTEAADTLRFNYLALGDSYTIGTGLPDPAGTYSAQLVARLNQEDSIQGDAPRIIARNGWTTGNLIFATDTASFDTTYSLVSLLIGVNNQFQNRPISEYAEHFTLLLERANGYANGDTSRVFVVSIPDYGVTPFGQANNPTEIAEEIDQLNAVNQSVSKSLGVTYFYITDISRTALGQPNMVASDNLHASAAMYSLWAASFYNTFKLKLYE